MLPVSAPVFFGAGLTHKGLVRERNEDSILTDPSGVLWAVADGMGGYGHGDVASDIVIDRLSQLPDNTLAPQAVRVQLQAANADILARTHAGKQMGSTVVAMLVQNFAATIAWVGDCRAYMLRGRSLRLLTRDHSVVQDMIEQGLLGDSERETHPERHVVTRAVGVEPDVEIDTITMPLIAGDRIVLCSDGLTTCIGDQRIAELLASATTPETACDKLMIAALEAGAPDNVSIITLFAAEG
ncbi:protein phosphatase 2C domain-containing protein [Lentibacter algarum]|uniref:PP2C family protein-serine/threonine phosphatase n=1 Tax=Lentibacter algarum TaxID=576131 RepID=UPI001C06DE56|nr:protein phosphatase 2C domain-containing protein [Lentibacter algarum]MBU2980577.1 protein phosphatase 2C domain-containing protein [Lentibacter algarum]